MGLGIVILSPLAIFETRDRVRFAAICGVAIAAMSPIVASLHLSFIHPFVRAWFVPDANFFAFFPWAAFIAFGLSAGSVLRLVEDADMHRVMQWAALMGFGLLFGAQYFSNLPYSIYPSVDFFGEQPIADPDEGGHHPAAVVLRFPLDTPYDPNGWSFVRQIGCTSLLVYWVHTELVYGRWFGVWKESLSTPQVVAMAAFIIALMVGLSVARTGWKGRPGLGVRLRQQWNAFRTMPANQPAGD